MSENTQTPENTKKPDNGAGYVKKLELLDGYAEKTKEGIVTHREVEFTRRPIMRDLYNIESNRQSAIPTQYSDLFNRVMITKFGSLKPMPVMLNVLLSLNQFDREDLAEAADEFLIESRGDRTSDFLSDDTVKLFFGFNIDGAMYDIVQFGKMLTGRDLADADEFGSGAMRACFEYGRQIVSLKTSDGSGLELAGEVALDKFETLDAEDYAVLRTAALRWRESFRLKRKALQKKRDGGSRVSADAGNAFVGSGS